MTLTVRILIGMAAGILLGAVIQNAVSAEHWLVTFVVGDVLDIGGRIFIASLRLMVVPLVFVSLVCGASSLSDGASMGRLGGKALGLYLLTTAVAVSLALSIALVVDPGEGAPHGSVRRRCATSP